VDLLPEMEADVACSGRKTAARRTTCVYLVADTMADHEKLQALVFGASGITGHAILKELVNPGTTRAFDRTIGLTNRPLSKEAALLPEDDRIEVLSELDLTDRDKTFELLKDIADIEKTTHVYFSAYAGHGSDYRQLKKVNSDLLQNAVDACDSLCPAMRFFTLQTGGKVRVSSRDIRAAH
jgi:nucleoside-diphosphate-sugar epimerase